MWDLSSPTEPVSPALEGGFFTTGPPGKSWLCLFNKAFWWFFIPVSEHRCPRACHPLWCVVSPDKCVNEQKVSVCWLHLDSVKTKKKSCWHCLLHKVIISACTARSEFSNIYHQSWRGVAGLPPEKMHAQTILLNCPERHLTHPKGWWSLLTFEHWSRASFSIFFLRVPCLGPTWAASLTIT